MNTITIFTAECRGTASNAQYPHKVKVSNLEEFTAAIAYDHVCAEYKGAHRSNDDFLSADAVMFDCDNTHSDDPTKWVQPKHIAMSFPGLEFYVCYSRHHNEKKHGQSPRPRFHVYFPVDKFTDAKQYADFKKSVIDTFPELHFDDNACDAARFFFGVENPQTELIGGEDA